MGFDHDITVIVARYASHKEHNFQLHKIIQYNFDIFFTLKKLATKSENIGHTFKRNVYWCWIKTVQHSIDYLHTDGV